MANVQVEHGHVRLANTLWEAILTAQFSGTQLRIILAIIRLSYGWRRKTVQVSQRQLAGFAGIKHSTSFLKALHMLVKEGVVSSKTSIGKCSIFSIQKDFECWGKFTVTPSELWPQRASSQGHTLTRGSPLIGIDTPALQGYTPRPHRGIVTGRKAKPTTELQAPKYKKAIENKLLAKKTSQSWVSTYLEAWHDQYATTIAAGATAKYLRPIHSGLGSIECLKRWRNYLAETELRYASAKRFSEIHTAFAASRGRKQDQRLAAGAGPTTAELV